MKREKSEVVQFKKWVLRKICSEKSCCSETFVQILRKLIDIFLLL